MEIFQTQVIIDIACNIAYMNIYILENNYDLKIFKNVFGHFSSL